MNSRTEASGGSSAATFDIGSPSTAGAALGSARTVWMVAAREISIRVRSTSFVLGTLGILLAIAAQVGLMSVVSDDTKSVAFIGDVAAAAEPVRTAMQSAGAEIEIRQVSSLAAGEQLIRDGDLDALVVGSPTSAEVIVRSDVDPQLRAALDAQVQGSVLNAELLRAGLEPEQVGAALAGATSTVRSLDPIDADIGQRLTLSLASSILLYFFLVMFGVAVAQGVVEEKSSRVVEVLLASIRPWQLMAGKLIGIGIVGLLQFAIIGGAALTGALATDLLTLPSSTVLGTLLSALLWYVVGFFFFAAMLAAAAALVSRQEDVQSVLQPVMIIIAVTFVLSIALITGDPRDPRVEWLSMVPPFSPVLMPARTALGTVPIWQIGVSAALALGAVAMLAAWGGRIYTYAVLRTGARVSLTDALKRS